MEIYQSMDMFKIWNIIVKIEGSTYNIDPNDPGGATKYGISQRAYPGLNIEKITAADAFQIFQNDYFAKVRADWWLSHGYNAFAVMLSAFAFHAGVKNAVKALQTVMNNSNSSDILVVDGDLGPKTLSKMESFKNLPELVASVAYPDLIAEILAYYKDLYIFKLQAKGYINRIVEILRACRKNNFNN